MNELDLLVEKSLKGKRRQTDILKRKEKLKRIIQTLRTGKSVARILAYLELMKLERLGY